MPSTKWAVTQCIVSEDFHGIASGEERSQFQSFGRAVGIHHRRRQHHPHPDRRRHSLSLIFASAQTTPANGSSTTTSAVTPTASTTPTTTATVTATAVTTTRAPTTTTRAPTTTVKPGGPTTTGAPAVFLQAELLAGSPCPTGIPIYDCFAAMLLRCVPWVQDPRRVSVIRFTKETVDLENDDRFSGLPPLTTIVTAAPGNISADGGGGTPEPSTLSLSRYNAASNLTFTIVNIDTSPNQTDSLRLLRDYGANKCAPQFITRVRSATAFVDDSLYGSSDLAVIMIMFLCVLVMAGFAFRVLRWRRKLLTSQGIDKETEDIEMGVKDNENRFHKARRRQKEEALAAEMAQRGGSKQQEDDNNPLAHEDEENDRDGDFGNNDATDRDHLLGGGNDSEDHEMSEISPRQHQQQAALPGAVPSVPRSPPSSDTGSSVEVLTSLPQVVAPVGGGEVRPAVASTNDVEDLRSEIERLRAELLAAKLQQQSSPPQQAARQPRSDESGTTTAVAAAGSSGDGNTGSQSSAASAPPSASTAVLAVGPHSTGEAHPTLDAPPTGPAQSVLISQIDL